jgi:hypothetical protein
MEIDERLYTCALCGQEKPREDIEGFYGSRNRPVCRDCKAKAKATAPTSQDGAKGE